MPNTITPKGAAQVSVVHEALDKIARDLFQVAEDNDVSPVLLLATVKHWAERQLSSEIAVGH